MTSATSASISVVTLPYIALVMASEECPRRAAIMRPGRFDPIAAVAKACLMECGPKARTPACLQSVRNRSENHCGGMGAPSGRANRNPAST